MAKARALWQEGKYTESAAAMQSVSRPDAPLQVAMLGGRHMHASLSTHFT